MPDETRGRLDTEIDRAVRSMMNVDPPAGMRYRVGERIAAGTARTGRAFWTVPAFAAAVLVIALITAATVLRPGRGDTPAVPQVASAPGPVTAPLPEDLGVRTPAPNVPSERGREAAPQRPDTAESIFGAPTDMVSAASLQGQQATAAGEAKPADKPAPAAEPNQPVNIKLDLTITDQVGTDDPVKKVLAMIVADGHSGTIRNTGTVKDQGRVQIRAEARPKVLPSGQIRLMLALEYVPIAAGTDRPVQGSALHEQISTIIEPGKPVIVTQSADPASERRILVEVKATLVK